MGSNQARQLQHTKEVPSKASHGSADYAFESLALARAFPSGVHTALGLGRRHFGRASWRGDGGLGNHAFRRGAIGLGCLALATHARGEHGRDLVETFHRPSPSRRWFIRPDLTRRARTPSRLSAASRHGSHRYGRGATRPSGWYVVWPTRQKVRPLGVGHPAR